ncbi:MAG TPA: nicotinate-nucleotide adenylyltransferase [Tissierellaceae bacterium]|nr:nicotinate-nucleotide adenylyltransferase [Tissierellaceae bacterium]
MKIGILGGTFNPIHHGHLILSEYIREEARLDKIIFIPTGISPHKDQEEVLNKHDRKEMLKLALASNPNYKISTIEIDRQGKSYTIDTIKKLKNIYPKDDLYMIIGADSLLELNTWKDYEDIISSIKIIVMDRQVSCREKLKEKITYYNKTYQGQIKRIETPIIEISATEIRRRIKRGKSIKYLLPELVEDYIIKNKLYR